LIQLVCEKNLHLYRKHSFEIFKSEKVNEALTLVFMEKNKGMYL